MAIHQKRHKPMFSVTIKKEILEIFKYYAKKHDKNYSAFVSTAIVNWIKEKEPEVYEKYKDILTVGKEEELDRIVSPTSELDDIIKK